MWKKRDMDKGDWAVITMSGRGAKRGEEWRGVKEGGEGNLPKENSRKKLTKKTEPECAGAGASKKKVRKRRDIGRWGRLARANIRKERANGKKKSKNTKKKEKRGC